MNFQFYQKTMVELLTLLVVHMSMCMDMILVIFWVLSGIENGYQHHRRQL